MKIGETVFDIFCKNPQGKHLGPPGPKTLRVAFGPSRSKNFQEGIWALPVQIGLTKAYFQSFVTSRMFHNLIRPEKTELENRL